MEVIRTISSTPDLFERDNPGLCRIEELGKADPGYQEMILFKRTGTPHKNIPDNSEARRMGGEWSHISIMKNREILIRQDFKQDRIIPPYSYCKTIVETLHTMGRKTATLLETIKRH